MTSGQREPGPQFLELTYSIDGAGAKILAEIAKGREPPLRWLQPNYEEYLEGCRRFGVAPVDWATYQRRFLEVTGVVSNNAAGRSQQAWEALTNPSREQTAALSVLRGRRRWFRRRRWD